MTDVQIVMTRHDAPLQRRAAARARSKCGGSAWPGGRALPSARYLTIFARSERINFKDTSRPKTNTTRGGHGGGVLAKVSLFVREMNARNE